jgi:hypothetical protein
MHHAPYTYAADHAQARCLLVDFSKALAVIDHLVLIDIMSELKLPECVQIGQFLSNSVEATLPKMHVSNLDNYPLNSVSWRAQELNSIFMLF